MTKVLIHSSDNDTHATAVRWALGNRGVPALFWPAGQFPANQSLTIDIAAGAADHAIGTRAGSVDLGDVGTVWNRRQGKPLLSASVDPRDRDFAEEQSRQHLSSFLGTACQQALWVNSPTAASLEVDKSRQLLLARALGFAIPATLISNDADRILQFYDQHHGDIIYKTYKLGVWSEGNAQSGVFVNYTTTIVPDHLSDRAVLELTPGIFQQKIEKAFEVRVTIIGASIFAARMDTHPALAESIDWRSRPTQPPDLSVHELPAPVADHCLRYMAASELVFACFDFLVDRQGTYIFLEVNQMGQFLWVEEQLPGLPLLDAMCGLLASGDPGYRWTRGERRIGFGDFLAARSAGAVGAP